MEVVKAKRKRLERTTKEKLDDDDADDDDEWMMMMIRQAVEEEKSVCRNAVAVHVEAFSLSRLKRSN